MRWFSSRIVGRSRRHSTRRPPDRNRRLVVEQFEVRRVLTGGSFSLAFAGPTSLAPVSQEALAITSVSPTAGSTNVSTATAVTVQFNNPMNAATIGGTTIVLKDAASNPISATVAYDAGSQTATLTPSAALANSTTYTLTVSGGSGGVADANGGTLAADVTSSFTTAAAPLSIAAITPAAGSTNVSTATAVTVQFNNPMNAATIGGTTITLKDAASNPISATVVYDAGSQTATLTPSAALANSTTYTLTVSGGSGGVADANGSTLAADVTSSFTTAAAPLSIAAITPAAGSTNVATATAVTVQFNNPMNAATIGGTTIVLKDAASNPISATVAYDAGSQTATLTPSAALANSTTYTLTVSGGSGGVADANGSTLAADVTSSFTTAAAPLSIAAITPAAGSTNVATATAVTVQFNNPMNAATIGGTTIMLKDAASNPVSATVAYDAGSQTATLTPSAALANSTTYTLTVSGGSGGVADANGSTLAADVTSSFTTAAAPLSIAAITPAAGSTNVATATAVTVQFNNPMNAATIGGTTIVLKDAASNPISATVAYDAGSQTATLTPSAALANSTTYTLTVSGGSGGVADTNGSTLAADVTSSFTTAAAPLSIVAVTPTGGSTNVSTATAVTVQFNNPMNAATIGGTTIVLKDAASNPVSATVAYDAGSQTATLTPSAALANSTTYTLTVSGGSGGVADTNGSTLAADVTSSFTTAAAPLSIVAVTPTGGSTNVSTATAVTVQFNNPMNAATIGGTTIVLKDAASNPVSATVAYDAGSQTATLTPSAALANSTTYTLTVSGGSGGVADTNGSTLAADVTSSFTTAAAPLSIVAVTPTGGSTNVSTATAVTVQFNNPMNAATIGGTTIVLKDAASNPVSATVAYDAGSQTATLTPSAALANSTTYTLTVSGGSGGVADANGSTLAADVTSSFTTAAAPLSIVAITPAAGSTNVAADATITVQFNNPMATSTISSSTLFLDDLSHNHIALSVGYTSDTNTATLVPGTPLAPGITYLIVVTGGANGVADTNGDTLTGDVTSSFSTAAAPGAPALAPGQFSLWSNSTVPSYTDNPDSASVEVGVKFQVNVAGYVTGIRFYKGSDNVGTHLGNLWSSDGTLLATATFTAESASGWQQVNFSQPVLIQANTTLIASYFAPSGNYADDLNFFTSPFTDGPLTATGSMYLYSATSGFPTQTFANSNYYVDLVFSPLLGAITPANGALGVATDSTVAVQFLTAMNPATITTSTIQLQDAQGNPVTAAVAYDAGSNTATLTPATALSPGTVYTLTIVGGAAGVADASGNMLSANVTASFTTVVAAPAVVSITPANSASGVDVAATIRVQFNEPMNPATINANTIQLASDAGNTAIAVGYDAATNSATIAPSGPLTNSTTYTVTVVGGADGVSDTNGGTLPSNFTSSFTTAAPLGPGPFTIWTDGTVPAWVDNPDRQSTELGLKFQSSSAGYITGIRFYKSLANTGTHTVSLWTADGNLLAVATSTSETDSGWQEVDFAEPVLIQANQVYLASYLAPAGHYSDSVGGFSGGSHTTGPLTALAGVYRYTSTSSFPSDSYQGSNYWVDVILTSLVGAVTPAADESGVPTDTSVTVKFNAAMNAATVTSGTVELQDSSGSSVPTSLVYNAGIQSATLTPSAALNAGTTYTVVVQGGAGGVASSAGMTLTANYTSSFTTAATPPNGAAATSLWNGSATPSWIDNPDPQAVELGVRFQASVSGFITGAMFYKSQNDTGTHTASLWSGGGQLLATATFTGESIAGWQSVTFSRPVLIQANTVYIASYHTDTGNYSDDEGFFAGGPLTVGSLTALANSNGGNGVYAYGAGGIFPTQTFNSSNYWVDVLFVPAN